MIEFIRNPGPPHDRVYAYCFPYYPFDWQDGHKSMSTGDQYIDMDLYAVTEMVNDS